VREEDSSSQRDKITVLEIKKQRNEKSEIVLSDHSSIMIADDVLYSDNIFIGSELTQPQIRKLEFKSQVVFSKKYAISLIARQPQTRKMLEIKLIRKQMSRTATEEALNELEDLKLINDETLSRDWVLFRLNHHPESKRHIYLGLLKKGINKHTAQTVVSELIPFETECDAARNVLEKARLSDRSDSDRSAFLKSRGFTYNVINEVIRNM
jgi:regulatory protein